MIFDNSGVIPDNYALSGIPACVVERCKYVKK